MKLLISTIALISLSAAAAQPGVTDATPFDQFFISSMKVASKLTIMRPNGRPAQVQLPKKDGVDCELDVKPSILKDSIMPTEVPRLTVMRAGYEINSKVSVDYEFKDNAYFTKMECSFFKSATYAQIKNVMGNLIDADGVVPAQGKSEFGGTLIVPKTPLVAGSRAPVQTLPASR